MKARLAILISGRGSNMEALIRATQYGILKDVAEIVLVFSDNYEAKGLAIAQSFQIPTQFLEKKGKTRQQFDSELVQILQKYNIEWVILAGYMRIVSTVLLQAYPQKVLNIHPADTQLHQGLHGYQWAFENSLKSTKITVHFVDEGLDTGRIIAQQEVDIQGLTSLEAIEKRGLAVEHELYAQTIYNLLKNNSKM